MGPVRQIALLVDTAREYGRGLLRGIIRYQKEHGPWAIYFRPQGLEAPPPPWLGSWRGDGILARINDARMARAVLRTSVPVVDLRNALPRLNVPIVAYSNRSVVRLAFEHFVAQGFRHFAFCGTRRLENRNQDERSDLFARLVRSAGFSCSVYRHPGPRQLSWEAEKRHIARWLKACPKPLAVMACHDDRGHEAIEAALHARLLVPDEVAVLGVDNDPFLCNLSNPPLSSIDVFPERIGYEAAALLDRLMAGGPRPRRPLLLEPRALVIRRSSDFTSASDPHVAHALRLIREHAAEAVGIEQLLARVPVSRSTLFRRFKEHLGRSPKQELTRIRLQRAKELLAQPALSVEEVARQAFQTDVKHFIGAFRRMTGLTPFHFRRQKLAYP